MTPKITSRMPRSLMASSFVDERSKLLPLELQLVRQPRPKSLECVASLGGSGRKGDLQKVARVVAGEGSEFTRRSRKQHFAPSSDTLRPQIDQPVAGEEHVEIVLN